MNKHSNFAVKQSVTAGDKALPAPMQQRSCTTAKLFVDAAITLLKEKTWTELSVAELAKRAGRSVGVFYQRFSSKDAFLDVLMTAHFQSMIQWRESLVRDEDAVALYRAFLKRAFENIRDNRNLWHAALARAVNEPKYWSRYASFRDDIYEYIIEALKDSLGRDVTDAEVRRLRIAGQLFNSLVYNQIIHSPGILHIDDEDFYDQIETIVLCVSNLPGCGDVTPGKPNCGTKL